jgi:hypothetical protein
MAGRRNYGARVRRYSRHQRVLTEVQPSYTPESAATAQMWGQIKSGLEDGISFLRPAVEQEQTVRGEREALEAYESGSFEMRSPLTLRSRAFNTTGERLITNRAMQRFEEGLRDVQSRSTSVSSVQSNLQEFMGQFFEEMPDIPGLRTRFVSQFERAEASMVRAATQRAVAAANASRRRAVTETRELIEAEAERTALTAGTEGEVAEVITQGIELLAADGPPEAFEAAGVMFPPDPNRSGILRAEQINSSATEMRQNAEEVFLRAQILQSDTPMLLARAYEEEVFSGNADLPPEQSLRLLGSLRSTARQRESERLAAERQVETQLAEAANEELNPYIVAAENGVPQAMPQADRAALLESVSGNPTLLGQVETQLEIADAVVTLHGMSPQEQINFIEEQLAAFEATPGVDRREAALISELAPRLQALRRAIDEEQVGLDAAEVAVNSGALLDEEQMAELASRVAGYPELQAAYDTIEAAQDYITGTEALTGAQREQQFNAIEDALTTLSIEGGRVGAAAARQLDALEGARSPSPALTALAATDAARFASRVGVELEPFPEEASLMDVGATVATRIAQIQPQTQRLGVDYPVPITQSELEAISDMFQGANNASRVAFLQGFADMPAPQRERIFSALGQDNPQILAAARVSTTAPAASRAILAGTGSTLNATPTVVSTVEAQAMAPIMQAGILPPAELDTVRTTALQYARGMAVRQGLTEISPADLERGYDLALGANDEGVGGIEPVARRGFLGGRDFGVTILPTGVSGEEVAMALESLTVERLTELTGGRILDGFENEYNLERFTRQIAGLRPVAEGVYALTDAQGGVFRTPDGENPVLLIRLEDLLQ